MKYQAIKHNKTGTRLLGLFPTIEEARAAIATAAPRALRRSDSYIGGFPYFHEDADGAKVYTIQGLHELGIVCSVPDEDKAKLESPQDYPVRNF